MVLDFSKRIMNEVLSLADELHAPVFYVDTDSMQIPQADIPRLADAYAQRFGRALIGEDLG